MMLQVTSEIRAGDSCSVEIITPAERKDIILGARVTVGENTLFLDTPIGVNPGPDIALFIERLLSSSDVNITGERRLRLDGKSYEQLGIVSARESFRDTVEMIVPHSIQGATHVDIMRDEGNSEKQQWRLQMMSFASKVFQKSKDRGRVILMPGSSDIEYRLWQSLGFDIASMVFIEGDNRKYNNLISSLPSDVRVVNEYLGGSNHNFAPALLSQCTGKSISVLSLDTESNLSVKLYRDIVNFMSEADITADFVLVLNIVGQRDNIREIESLGREKLGDMYAPGELHPRSYVLSKIPEMILGDIQRDDLTLEQVSTVGYIGFGDTRMECVFSHFRKNL